VTFEWTVSEQHVGEFLELNVYMANGSRFKRNSFMDDAVTFIFAVSPPVPARVT